MNDSRSGVFNITTAIPFVNAPPHIGFAFEAVLADVLARHRRLRGDHVRFQSGTDDHSLKNVRAAEREGVSPQELVARHAQRFRGLAGALDLSYDDFLGTSVDPRHRPGVEALWRACSADLYKRPYRGLYCVGCEAFYTPAELPDGQCPEHHTTPELVEEDNWFFRLSRYQTQLQTLIAEGRLRIEPAARRNEVLGFLAGGLEDISVSRSRSRARGWGIPVPGDPDQVIYVWFDALANYINALDWQSDGADYRRFWQGPGRRVHVVGKGIVRFHAVHWPAILLAAGLPLPTDLVVHGYLTVDGQKIGKSAGNAVDPFALVERHGCDVVRHFLIRHVRPFEDGDFSEARLRGARDSELADQLGNLVRRTTTLLQRNSAGRFPAPGPSLDADLALRDTAAALPGRLNAALDDFAVDQGLGAVFELVTATNRYIEHTAPWALARAGDQTRLYTVLHHAAEAVRVAGVALAPFLPRTAAAIAAELGQDPPGTGWEQRLLWGGASWNREVRPGPVLFAKTHAERSASDSPGG